MPPTPPTPLIQPNADTCGQTCIAMVADVSVKKVVEILGAGRTTLGQIARVLRECGFAVFPGNPRNPPPMAICRINYRDGRGGWRKRSHWVLMWDGVIYDPLGPEMTAVIGIGKRKKGAIG